MQNLKSWDINDIWVCLIMCKKKQNRLGNYAFRFFGSVLLSAFLSISSILEPETAPSTELQHFEVQFDFFGNQDSLFCLCSSKLSSNNTCYWLLRALGGTHYIPEKHCWGARFTTRFWYLWAFGCKNNKTESKQKAVSDVRQSESRDILTYTQTDLPRILHPKLFMCNI